MWYGRCVCLWVCVFVDGTVAVASFVSLAVLRPLPDEGAGPPEAQEREGVHVLFPPKQRDHCAWFS